MQRLNLRIIRNSLVGIIVASIWYFLAVNGSDSPNTTVMFNVVLAFLAIICSAIVIVQVRDEISNPFQNTYIAFIFFSLIHLAGAIAGISSMNSLNDLASTVIAGDLLKIVIFLIIMAIAFRSFNEKKKNLRNVIGSGLILSVLSLVLMYIFYYYIFSIVPFEARLLRAILSIVITVVCCGYIFSVIQKNKNKITNMNSEFLITSFTLFAIASIPPVVSLYIQGPWWLFSVGIQVMAFLFFILGTQIPIFRQMGMRKNIARSLAFGIVLLALVSFNVTIFIEIITDGVLLPNPALYILSRVASIILSIEFVIFIVQRFRTSPKPSHQPLIALFGTWSIVEISLLLIYLGPLGTISQESVAPYVSGSLVVLIALWHLKRWTTNPHEINYQNIRKKWYIGGAIGVIAAIHLGVLIQIQLESSIPNLDNSILGPSLLLLSNLIALFAITYLLSDMVKFSKGRMNTEILAMFVASLWIVANILKSSYPEWSAGWWVADILKLFALLIVMGIIGIMYHVTIQGARNAHGKAQLFSDIIIHDIRNYHHAIKLSLDLAEISGSSTLDNFQDIREILKKADKLVISAERLGKAEKITESDLFPVDLVEHIRHAVLIVSKTNDDAHIYIHMDVAEGVCYVLANQLLTDIFLNLMENGIKHADTKKRIEIQIHETRVKGVQFWETMIIDYGNGIAPEKRKHLFQRFMGDAKGMGLGLSVVKTLVDTFNGTIEVESRIPEDFTKGSIFKVKFPCVEPYESSSTSES